MLYESAVIQVLREVGLLQEAKIAVNLKKGKLHKLLGVPEDKDITDLSQATIVSKAASAINSKKATYAEIIRMLNIIKVYNKKKNKKLADKIQGVQDKLKVKFKDKDKKKSSKKGK